MSIYTYKRITSFFGGGGYGWVLGVERGEGLSNGEDMNVGRTSFYFSNWRGEESIVN